MDVFGDVMELHRSYTLAVSESYVSVWRHYYVNVRAEPRDIERSWDKRPWQIVCDGRIEE